MFGPFESSRAKSRPATLYLFRYGPSPLNYYAYTDAEQSVRVDDIDYVPIPISRDKIVANGSLDKNGIGIRLARNNPMAVLFRPYPPSYTVTAVIYNTSLNDPDHGVQAIWNGRILSCAFEGDEAVLSGEPISSQRRRPGLRRPYQYGCPHVLYGQGPGKCNANKAAATFGRIVESVDGFTVVMPTGWFDPFIVSRFQGGLVEWTRGNGLRESRTILQVQNDRQLVLGGPPTDLHAGDSVEVVYGCSHTMAGCQNVHRNLLNFGGCPFIPTDNPIGTRNNFY